MSMLELFMIALGLSMDRQFSGGYAVDRVFSGNQLPRYDYEH